MTRAEALTMIIASIAMEELALGRIVSAESEKLQYILGTLPGGHQACANTREILAVNKSVTALLDTVAQNQMLLKGKLEKALEAGGCGPDPEPEPEPEPPCPCEPDRPPCTDGAQESAIHLTGRSCGFSWENGFFLPWQCRERRGRGIRWNEHMPALVNLDPEKAYALNYTINVRGPYPGDSAGAILVRLTPCDAFSDILPLYFSVKGSELTTLHSSAVLFPRANPAPGAGLSLLLSCRNGLLVERASLSIAEL